MMIRALEIVLLFTFVATLSGLPTEVPAPEVNTHEEHTLSTELQPPPLDEKEHHATVYIINLYAVKNSSGRTSEEVFENEIIETVPDILEPLATVFLVVVDEDEEKERHSPANLDEFAAELESQGFKIDKIDVDNKSKVLRMELEKTEAQSMIDSALKPDFEKKANRQKRTICMKCGGYGGYGGGGYGGGHVAVVPVVIVPVPRRITGGAGHYRRGGHGQYYPSGGGGGCNTCGGGGGGGGSYSQSSAQASASSSSGSWGKK
ncbi:keratin, type I cytoskeletal 9-like isoform X3 [Nylanderia fulva]|uniref:keratin, type I cytoskeletal 9-like isoform X3 n=1 Tax=Nylanderia fulva TaxID=613905 RepID=UPI0010FBACD2|nr:keratin, type I cytoskeletal 9-like isoform X3 [Nylanderia fulva]